MSYELTLCLSSSLQDIDEFKYHVILGDLLFPHSLYDGQLRATLLGSEYEIQFSINDDNQVKKKERERWSATRVSGRKRKNCI